MRGLVQAAHVEGLCAHVRCSCTSYIRCDECGAVTEENKPKCRKHFWALPHAKKVVSELAEKAEHDAQAALGNPTLTSITVQDILGSLETLGPSTLEGLAKRLTISFDAVRTYVEEMRRAGLVVVVTQELADHWKLRGRILVRLVSEET